MSAISNAGGTDEALQLRLLYQYDAFGHRLVKLGGAQAASLYQYDLAGHLLEEDDAQAAARVDYVYLNDQPLATFVPGSSQLSFLHTDRLGTPQVASNSSKTIVWRGDFDPFGTLNPATSQTATLTQSLRFPGQEFEPETGWHQNGFRDYAPSLGRYLESDPIGVIGGYNGYVHVRNNPGRFTDRWGLAPADLSVSAQGTGSPIFTNDYYGGAVDMVNAYEGGTKQQQDAAFRRVEAGVKEQQLDQAGVATLSAIAPPPTSLEDLLIANVQNIVSAICSLGSGQTTQGSSQRK